MSAAIDVERTRQALASSPLNHGLAMVGDRWTVQVLLGTFLGLKRFEQWQQVLGIPRHTLAQRLRKLIDLGLLKPRPYQLKPLRQAYHASAKAMAMYPQVLMMWAWEKRWGGLQSGLPDALLHKPCGHLFAPVLTCQACEQDADITAMRVQLQPTEPTEPARSARSARPARTTRLVWRSATPAGLDHRVDRWNLLIVAAVVLGCHHFDQLSRALGIGSSTLARRLQSMVESGLLRTQADRHDGRRRRYTLTDSSRDLLGYIVCLSRWAGQTHLQQSSSIVPIHSCGQPFVARVACSACRQEVHAWQVQPQYRSGEPAGAAPSHGRAGAPARRAAAAALEGSD